MNLWGFRHGSHEFTQGLDKITPSDNLYWTIEIPMISIDFFDNVDFSVNFSKSKNFAGTQAIFKKI